MKTTTTKLAVWIGCLASYNAGELFGEWVNLDGLDVDDLQAEISRILAASPSEDAEEWAFMDFDMCGLDLGEYCGLDVLVAAAEALGGADDPYLMAEYMNDRGFKSACDIDDLAESFADEYVGEFDRDEDLAIDLVSSTGMLDGVPDTVARYFDYEAFGRLILGGDYSVLVVNHRRHYFHNY